MSSVLVSCGLVSYGSFTGEKTGQTFHPWVIGSRDTFPKISMECEEYRSLISIDKLSDDGDYGSGTILPRVPPSTIAIPIHRIARTLNSHIDP